MSANAKPGFDPIITPEAVTATSEELAATGTARVDNLLDESAAQLLREAMDDLPWSLAIRVGDKDQMINAAMLEKLGEETFRKFALDGADNDFRMIYDTVHVPNSSDERAARDFPIDQMALDWAKPEARRLWARLLGVGKVDRVVAMASRYRPGHFLSPHNDSDSGKRIAAFVLSLSREWEPHWGGQLQVEDDSGELRIFTPRFNTLSLFTVPRWHFVSQVADYAPQARHSITGWFIADPE